MKHLATLAFAIVLSCAAISQERAPHRVTTYHVQLNALKFQDQVDGIEQSVRKLPNVISCDLNWTEYMLTFVVEEGYENGNFSMEALKAIIDENRAQLVKFDKEIKR